MESAMAAGRLFIGTSGWNYDHWKGTFYPESEKKKAWFEYYRSRFSTVEINNTFYNLPAKDTFNHWYESAGKNFIFSIKASRYITHMKKLKDPEQATGKFFNAAGGLKEKLGPILFQLPPKWNRNTERLDSFLRLLPAEYKYTFEFRDPSWFHDDIYKLLSSHNAAFCMYHLEGNQSPREVTADFVYIRLHGPKGAYEGKYTTRELSGWAGAISAWRQQGRDVYCYFDNDQRGYAPQNALELQSMLSG